MSTYSSGSSLPQAPTQNRRPTSATVFAILNFVFGGLGVCGTIVAVVSMIVPDAMSFGQENPVVDAMAQDSTATMTNWISNGLGLVAVVLLLAGGAGLWAIKPYGRTCTIYYAVLALLSLVFQIVVHIFVTMPLLDKVLLDIKANPVADKTQQSVLEMTVDITKYTVFAGFLFAAIYPVFCLIFMNRRPILERYKPGYNPDAGNFDSPKHVLPSSYTPPDQSNPYSSPFDPK